MSEMNLIVKKVLERAAAEIVEELGVAKDIQYDVLTADEREKWWRKVWSLEELNGALKSEHEKVVAEYSTLNQKYVQLEAAYNELFQLMKEQVQKEETLRNTISFLEQTIQTSNAMNMSAVTQIAHYKQKVAVLEMQLQGQVMARARESLLKSIDAPEYTPK